LENTYTVLVGKEEDKENNIKMDHRGKTYEDMECMSE
jgi:hypothetical protein